MPTSTKKPQMYMVTDENYKQFEEAVLKNIERQKSAPKIDFSMIEMMDDEDDDE